MNFLGTFLAINELASLLLVFAFPRVRQRGRGAAEEPRESPTRMGFRHPGAILGKLKKQGQHGNCHNMDMFFSHAMIR